MLSRYPECCKHTHITTRANDSKVRKCLSPTGSSHRALLALPSMSSSSTSTTDKIIEKLPSAKELEQDVAVATKKSLSSLRDFAAGGVGGIFAVVVGHPFDLVKVRLQTAEKGVYTGAMDVVRKTIAREGPIRVSIVVSTIRRRR